MASSLPPPPPPPPLPLPPSFFLSTWDYLPSRMIKPQYDFAVVGCSRLKKFVVIGSDEKLLPLCQVFHTRAQTWERLQSPTAVARYAFSAAWVDSRIYVMGGFETNGNEPRAIECNHDGDAPSPMMTRARRIFSSSVVGKKIIIAGGLRGSGGLALQSVEQFDTETHAWTDLPDMLQPRVGCMAASIKKKFYVFGGEGAPHHHITSSTAEVYDTETKTWKALPNMPRARVNGAAVAVGHYILLVGGYNGQGIVLADVDCFDTVMLKWVVTGMIPSLRVGRMGCAAVCIENQVFVLGGSSNDEIMHDTVEVIEIHPYYIMVPKLRHLWKQNDLPLSFWPHILARCGNDASSIFAVLCSDKFTLDSVLFQHQSKEE